MPPHSRRRHSRRGVLRRVLAILLAVLVVLAALVGVSLIGALRTPGNQSFEAKWADWLRSHHMASLANDLETYYYQHNAPPKGGQPAHLNAVPSPPPTTTPPQTTPAKRRVAVVAHLRPPTAV